MRRVHIVYERGVFHVTVYDGDGRRVKTVEDNFETVKVTGANSVLFSKGVEGSSLLLEYEGEVCLDRKGMILEVRGCGVSGGEE